MGAKYTISFGALVLAIGTCLFGWGMSGWQALAALCRVRARLLHLWARFIWLHGVSQKYLATAVGATQCAGMLGGAMGQSTVAWLIHGVINWHFYWIDTGLLIALIAVFLFVMTPQEKKTNTAHVGKASASMFAPYKSVLSNPQSYLCGLCAGLLFLPTTVGSMTWGITF